MDGSSHPAVTRPLTPPPPTDRKKCWQPKYWSPVTGLYLSLNKYYLTKWDNDRSCLRELLLRRRAVDFTDNFLEEIYLKYSPHVTQCLLAPADGWAQILSKYLKKYLHMLKRTKKKKCLVMFSGYFKPRYSCSLSCSPLTRTSLVTPALCIMSCRRAIKFTLWGVDRANLGGKI